MTLWTEDPRLAALYDIECAGREDHDFYLRLADRVHATSVVDVGCGTGVFAVDVASSGTSNRRVVGVDPALPMLDIARARPGGDTVTWHHGTASGVASASADLVIMMGHVAQYFVSDAAWAEVLAECGRILAPGGTLAFEVRNPTRNWPQRWTKALTLGTHPHPDGGSFTSWVEVVDVSGPSESFTLTHEGHSVLANGESLSAKETLRFRSPDETLSSVEAAGFVINNIWGDWDGSDFVDTSDELIVCARRPTPDTVGA